VGVGVLRGTGPARAGKLGGGMDFSRDARGVVFAQTPQLSSVRPAAARCCVSDVPDAEKEPCRFGIHGSAAGRSLLG
jgi:hypothetical protein